MHRADVDADLPHARGDMGQAQSTWSSQCAVISIRMLDWLEEFLHDMSDTIPLCSDIDADYRTAPVSGTLNPPDSPSS